MANTEDLRYVRTEHAIRTAFMELVSTGASPSPTVSAVCRRAGISRNAFYLHHANVDALYATLVSELVEAVRAESLASARRCVESGKEDELEDSVISGLADHEDVLRALIPSDDGSLVKRLADGIEAAFIESSLLFGEHGGSLEHRLGCAYSAWALVGFAQRWIADTKRPLTDGKARFRELHACTHGIAVRRLLEEASGQ